MGTVGNSHCLFPHFLNLYGFIRILQFCITEYILRHFLCNMIWYALCDIHLPKLLQ